MPRVGGVYSLPASSLGVSGQTIESAKYNGVIQDFESDANAARPVVAGGTGGTTKAAAHSGLGIDERFAVGDLTTLKALTAGLYSNVYMEGRASAGDGGAGWFIWRSGDQSTNVTNDANNGVWVPPDSDNTGASGAWERADNIVTAKMFGATGDGTTDDLAAMNKAVAWLNAADKRTLVLTDGTYQLSGDIDAITGADKSMVHVGAHAAELRVSTSVTDGKIIKIGDGGSTATARVVIQGIDMELEETTGTSGAAITVDGANDIMIRDVRVLEIASLVRIGETDSCARLTMENIKGTFNGASNGNIIHVEKATGCRFKDLHITDTLNSTGSMVHIVPTDLCDTFWFEDMHVWTSGYSDYGVYIDIAAGDCVNVWFDDCVFDKSEVSGYHLVANSGANEARNHYFTNTRWDTAGGGNAIRVIENSAGACIIRGLNFLNCNLTYRDDEAVRITTAGSGYLGGVSFISCDFQEASSVTINAAVEIGCDDWQVVGCKFGYAEDTFSSHTTYAVKTTADVANYVVASNEIKCPANVIQHFAYASDSGNRLVYGNTGETVDEPFAERLSGQKVIFYHGGELTIATGAVTVTHSSHGIDTESDAASDDLDTINGGIDGMRLILRAQSSARTVVVKDGTGNINLVGGADFSLDNSHDRIELVYDGVQTGWFELSRSDISA